MSDSPNPLPLFAGIGVELEYMIVDAQSLQVRPIADQLLRDPAGHYVSSIECGELAWFNELALHVIELKTKGPVASLIGLPEKVTHDIALINRQLEPLGACLLSTAMHPWMDPSQETKLWPHDYSPVYEAFNRIFGCQGHGWSNLQSLHLNLPFANDDEFGRLHAAIRLLLPLLPALAASSPFHDGKNSGYLDSRLKAYRGNCARIPSVTGQMIPEPVFTPHDYETQILQRIYRDIAPLDPEGVLQEEWLNARGAIARFDRNTIEIRVLDVQETPQADLASAALIIAVLRALVAQRWSDWATQQTFATDLLEDLLFATVQKAEDAFIMNEPYLRAFGLSPKGGCTAGEFWSAMAAQLMPSTSAEHRHWGQPLNVILKEGTLANRILRATGKYPSQKRLHSVYNTLRECLANGVMFHSP